MLDRYRGQYCAAGRLLAVLAAVFLCSTGSLQAQEGGQTQTESSQDQTGPADSDKGSEPEGHPPKYQFEVRPLETHRPGGSPDPKGVPSEDDREAQANQDKFAEEANDIARLDLAAQERMARATERMNYATWASVALTVMAVILLWGTLLYTRQAAGHTKTAATAAQRAANAALKANQINRALFVAENRPWINVTVEVGSALKFDANGATLKLKIMLENTGKSTAEAIHRKFVIHPHAEDTREQLEALALGQMDLEWPQDDPGELLFPGHARTVGPTIRISKDCLAD